jgi:4-amino-4-deoxychorismate lyase
VPTKIFSINPQASPAFSPDDRLYLGEALFETLRVSHARPCFANLHWQRLKKGAMELGIPFDLTLDTWQHHLLRRIKKDKLYQGGIKVILSGGSAPRGLTERGKIGQLILQTFHYQISNKPIRLMSASWLRDAANPIYSWKSPNYLEAIIARREALAHGLDDALFYNTDHHATETTTANLFLIKGNSLFTAPLNDGVLAGITRSRIFTKSLEQSIACHETSITKPMLKKADTVFVCNSLQGIQSVFSLDDTVFNLNHPLLEELTSLLLL